MAHLDFIGVLPLPVLLLQRNVAPLEMILFCENLCVRCTFAISRVPREMKTFVKLRDAIKQMYFGSIMFSFRRRICHLEQRKFRTNARQIRTSSRARARYSNNVPYSRPQIIRDPGCLEKEKSHSRRLSNVPGTSKTLFNPFREAKPHAARPRCINSGFEIVNTSADVPISARPE